SDGAGVLRSATARHAQPHEGGAGAARPPAARLCAAAAAKAHRRRNRQDRPPARTGRAAAGGAGAPDRLKSLRRLTGERSAELLGEPDEQPSGPADVAESVSVFIPDDFAGELRPARAQP